MKSALKISVLLLGAALGLLALRHALLVILHPYPLEYGEGINLLWAERVLRGESLYPTTTPGQFPHLHNPYPPGYPMATALLKRAGCQGHPFLAGRLLSLTGLLLGATAIVRLLRRRISVRFSLLAGLTFLLSPMILRFGPMQRVDSLALGFALWALDHLDRGGSSRNFFFAAMLAAAAVCVKPTFFAAGLCLIFQLPRPGNRRMLPAALFGGLLPLAALGTWLWSRESPEWMLHLWTMQGLPLNFDAGLDWMSRFAGSHAPLLALAAAGGFAGRHQTSNRLILQYALLSLLAPLLTGGITGSQENYLMEVWASACLLGFLQLSAMPAGKLERLWFFLLCQWLLFLPVAPAPVFTRTYGQELPAGASSAWTPTAADGEAGRLVMAELRLAEGPILSSDPGFLLAAGHELHYQPFQFEHLQRAGKWTAPPLTEALQSGWFSHVLLKGDAAGEDDPYFRDEIQREISRRYELHRVTGPWHLYRRN